MSQPPLVIAHRGFSARFPENTLVAVRGAMDAGADMVEIDVQQTRDGEIVVFHDVLLRRLCNLDGRVHQKTLTELQRGKPDLPTLAQTLRAVKGRCRLLIEMKTVEPPRVARIIAAADMVEQVIVFSFDTARMQQLASANARIPRFGLIGTDLRPSLRAIDRGVSVTGIGVGSHLLKSMREVREIQKHNKQVFVWTVNRESRMRELMTWGVDGLITNHPDRAKRVTCP